MYKANMSNEKYAFKNESTIFSTRLLLVKLTRQQIKSNFIFWSNALLNDAGLFL